MASSSALCEAFHKTEVLSVFSATVQLLKVRKLPLEQRLHEWLFRV